MKFWQINDENARYFRHCHFKGDATNTTTRNIPSQTANEASLENGLINYDTTGLSNANSILKQAISSIGNTVNPDWSSLANAYNKTMSGVTSGYSSLTNGELPTSYATARQQALNSDLSGTIGSSISSLGSRGILNSSVTNNALNNISQNASDTLAKNYSSDLSTEANLLNGQATQASNVLSNNATSQQNSYYQPTSLLSYASQMATPAQNMYNTMYNGRMNSGGTTTTQSSGGKGSDLWSGVGSIGSAMITGGKKT
jgi:hypothetical protein